jgi:hypothetical protein
MEWLLHLNLESSISCAQNTTPPLRLYDSFAGGSFIDKSNSEDMHRLRKRSSQCFLLWAGSRVDPLRPQTDQNHEDVITLRNRSAMGQQYAGTDWKQTRPSCCNYGPLRPHEQIVSPPISIEVKNQWSHTSAPSWLGQGKQYTWPFSCQSRLRKKEDNWSCGQV